MTLVSHELKQGLKNALIWTVSIVFFIVICVLMYPEMKDEMNSVTDMFSSMGAFTDAFGMDRLNFGTLIGFYAIECGNILGIGGAFFASILGIQSLAKEEKDHTSEFLLSHPISRTKIVFSKFLALNIQILILNVIAFGCAIASILYIQEEIPWKELCLLHSAYYFVQLELCFICFGISAFSRQNGYGLGIGIAAIFYFMNIVSNITESVGFIKDYTPFGYAEAANIVSSGNLDWLKIGIHILISLLFVLIAWLHYRRKNIQ